MRFQSTPRRLRRDFGILCRLGPSRYPDGPVEDAVHGDARSSRVAPLDCVSERAMINQVGRA
jgi:hypothetical protein